MSEIFLNNNSNLIMQPTNETLLINKSIVETEKTTNPPNTEPA